MSIRSKVQVSPSSEDSQYEFSVLCREWKRACLLSWIVFCSYEILIFSQDSLCSSSAEDYRYFFMFANISTLSGFGFTWIVLIARIFRSRAGNERVPHWIAFHVALMGLITAILDITAGVDRICIDVLGVATPAALWGEWFSCGPLLIFFTLSMVDKKQLNKMDWTIIITFFLTIIFGFIIIIPQPTSVCYFWFVLSFLSFLPTVHLPWHVSNQEDGEKIDIDTGVTHRSIRREQRFHFAVWLTFAFPLFPVVYLLAAFDAIGPDVAVGLFLLLSVIMKGFLLVVIMEEFSNALSEVRDALSKEQFANRMRRAFLKYIFHEVRTPLNSMVMGLEILKKSDHLDASETDLLIVMHSATDFMSETLNNVLSMQKMEEGKVQLEMSAFSIADSITKVSSSLAGALVTKNLNLERTMDASVPDRISGDRYRVEHVVSNLLSNATKFSPEGGTIRIHVAAEETADETTTAVTVSITDEGHGISAEDQKRLFENFFQIRPNQLQQGQGSGLGLSLCKQIVSLHGGTIRVDSVEGVGSTFSFTIPFGVVPIEEVAQAALGIEIRTISVHANANIVADVVDLSQNHRILVVDDVSSNRKMLKMLLSRSGAEIDLAENGQEAVTKVQQRLENDQYNLGGYDIVFMDNLMPVMDGVEGTRLLRKVGYKNLVIGVTGNVMDDDVIAFQDAGVDFVMAKPVKMNLLSTILAYVKNEGSLSRPGMTLVVDQETVAWKAKNNWKV